MPSNSVDLDILRGDPDAFEAVGRVTVRADLLRPRVTALRALDRYLDQQESVAWYSLGDLFVTVGEHSYRLIVDTAAEPCR